MLQQLRPAYPISVALVYWCLCFHWRCLGESHRPRHRHFASPFPFQSYFCAVSFRTQIQYLSLFSPPSNVRVLYHLHFRCCHRNALLRRRIDGGYFMISFNVAVVPEPSFPSLESLSSLPLPAFLLHSSTSTNTSLVFFDLCASVMRYRSFVLSFLSFHMRTGNGLVLHRVFLT